MKFEEEGSYRKNEAGGSEGEEGRIDREARCTQRAQTVSSLTRPIKEWNEFPPEATAAGSLDTYVSRVC